MDTLRNLSEETARIIAHDIGLLVHVSKKAADSSNSCYRIHIKNPLTEDRQNQGIMADNLAGVDGAICD